MGAAILAEGTDTGSGQRLGGSEAGRRRAARAEARPGVRVLRVRVRVCVRTELERRPLNCGQLRKMGEAQSDMPLSPSS